jgi:molybdate transport system substrate-binding protein
MRMPTLLPFGEGCTSWEAIDTRKGEVELGIDVIPQIVAVQGVQLVGPLPGDLQIYVEQTAAISSSAKDAAAATALLDFLKGPTAMPVFKAKGMEPG